MRIVGKLLMLIIAVFIVFGLIKALLQPVVLAGLVVFVLGWGLVAALVGWSRNQMGGARAAADGGVAGMKWLLSLIWRVVGGFLRFVFHFFLHAHH